MPVKRAMALLALLALLAAGFAAPASAKDSGDEKVIPIKLWECYLCNMKVCTFASDVLEASPGKSFLKDGAHQQANFKYLYDRSRSIEKCPKFPMDGGHVFVGKGAHNISPKDLANHIRKFIVLQNGKDNTIKMDKIECALCGIRVFCFHGDDLDQYDFLDIRVKAPLWILGTSNAFPPCDKVYFTDGRENKIPFKHHIFRLHEVFTPPSAYSFSEKINSMIFSD
ncbi:MAG: hypothetical protein IKX75_02950 [Desulfovibrio sp.]|nr:hypothetical protein [Desulfovibrio sp.]